jgi:hypothetical protein
MRDAAQAPLVRRTASVAIVAVLTVGVTGGAGAKNPGPSQLPTAVTGTVKDICTGASIPAPSVRITDADGGTLTPSKQTATTFTFAWFASSAATLHVSAPGYQALGDPAAPDPGVAFAPPTGPFAFVGGGHVTERLTMAAQLAPTGGCPTPKAPKQAVIKGTLHDAQTHAVIDAPAFQYHDKGTGQAAGKRTHGTITITHDESQSGTFTADVPGYRPLTNVFAQPEPQFAGGTAGGALTIGQLFDLSVQPVLVDLPPVIQFLDVLEGTSTGVDQAVTLEAVAYDPEGQAITVQWDAGVDGSSCTFSAPTALNSTVSCGSAAYGHSVVIRLTVTDPGLHSTSRTLTVSIY